MMRGRGWLAVGAIMVGFGLACTGEGPSPEPDEGASVRVERDRTGARRGRAQGDDGTVSAESAPSASAETSGPPAGITDLGNRTWSVKKRLVNKYEDHPDLLANTSQKGDGWELKRVKKGDAQYLGMLNGDVIKTVNGYSLGSNTELAVAYAALKNAKKFTVKFKRDGKTKTHTYKIVD